MSGRYIWAEIERVPGADRAMKITRVTSSNGWTAGPNASVLVEADVSPITHYWDASLSTPLLFPPNPGMGWRFDYASRQWAPDVPVLWAMVRRDRDALLSACDWRILPDAPGTDEERAAWLTYRKALRDITLQADPTAITWPAAPE